MTVTTTNTAPVELHPTQFSQPLTDAGDGGHDYTHDTVFMEVLTHHWVKKQDPNSAISITWTPNDVDNNGNTNNATQPITLAPNAVVGTYINACSDEVDAAVDHTALEITGALSGADILDKVPSMRNLFTGYAMTKANLPRPVKGKIIYTVSADVQSAAQSYLQNYNNNNFKDASKDAYAFAATLGIIYKPQTLGVWIKDETTFENFKEYLARQVAKLSSQDLLSDATIVKFQKFRKLSLNNLTASLRLRSSKGEATGSYSFVRVLTHVLYNYIETEHQYSTCPTIDIMGFDLNEVIKPASIVFTNLEKHASAKVRDIDAHWSAIAQALQRPVHTISLTEIASLTTESDQQNRLMQRSMQRHNQGKKNTRREYSTQDFGTQPPAPARIAKDVMRILTMMGKVNTSKNIHKYRKKSFNKQSRRHPDNPNIPGRTRMKRYYPDVHIYADTSSSIAPEEYEAAIKIIAVLAKKLGFNIYFSSFTHDLSKEIELHTKGRSPQRTMALIRAIPKLDGGTEFENPWRNASQDFTHKSRCNIIISDMNYTPRRYQTFDHPESMFYIPIITTPRKWQAVARDTAKFCNQMQDFVPDIRSRILGL